MAHGSWPHVEDHYLGARESFSKMGLSCISHLEEQFSLSDNECEITLRSTIPVKITTQLIDCHDQSRELSDYVFTQRQTGVIYFLINFPRPGFYQFEIYALPADHDNKILPNVFNYLIRVEHATKVPHAFPKQYAQWKDGCYLYHPVVLNSSSHLQNVHFKVHIPGAKNAAIVVDGIDWYHLDSIGENYEGTISLESFRNSGAKITLNAKYLAGNTYATLLEYRL